MKSESNSQHVGKVTHHELKQTLGTWQLWGIAVGLVISGEYFGWSYGWASAGTLGFVITAVFIAAIYTTFIFSFTELTTSIPHAGGPFAYARHAFGATGGYLAGAATLVEFVFAPPAIALAIGAYLHVQFPALEPKHAAMGAYLVFMALNIVGVQITAAFELCVTLLAIFELLVFMGVVSPGFQWSNFTKGGWAGADTFSMGSFNGMFAAIPFAIWFFLAIEGVAMAAEEAKNSKRSIPIAYVAGILTLVVLAIGVIGIAAIYSDELIQFGGQTLTANIVTMSVFGAIVMYIISMLSLFKLRRAEPDMERPFRAPLFPLFPAFALVAAVICLATMVYFNFLVAVVFAIFLALGYVYFLLTRHQRETAPADALLEE
ncbi:MAG: Ethanolamine permease [uncultured Paraburkholderia sp.]|nr:MAG: Ethanolamine permease [uncultured Paraburkholderia sp.]